MTTYSLGTIHPGSVATEFMQSVIGLLNDPGDGDLKLDELILKESGPYLDVARNYVVERFMAGTSDVLLFVDSDVIFRPEQARAIVAKVSEAEPIIGGMYVNHFTDHGIRPVALTWEKVDDQPQMVPVELPDTDDLVSVDCVGTGFMAIHRSLLERFKTIFHAPCPWFAEEAMNGSQMGEDVTFCQRAVHLGYPVFLDPSIRLDHLKTIRLTPPSAHKD